MTDKPEKTDPWGPPKAVPELEPALLERWRSATSRLCTIGRAEGWTRAEAARRTDIPAGTLTPLLDGAYTGNHDNQVAKLEKWLASREELARRAVTLPTAPGFIQTPTARELVDTLLYAQAAPQIAAVTLGSGMGKTTVAHHFRSTRPGVHYVRMRPTTRRTFGMLQEIAAALEITERTTTKLDRAIGQKIRRNGRNTLLIVDEAQNLSDEAVDQLRYFYDDYGCGVALLGNMEIYSRFGRSDNREGFGQIHSRIGKRLLRIKPRAGDVDALLDAWTIDDAKARKLLHHIAGKPGSLRQVTETIKLATMIASGAGEALGYEHLRSAWENRAGEEARP